MEEKKCRIKNYSFISYKRIKPDEEWAQALHDRLNNWYIPTEIEYEERLNNNKRIDPVIRDKDNFPPGNGLDETIKNNLRESRTLIVIISKAMLEDQVSLRNKGEHAYILEEIEYFQSLERPRKSIIPVYIDNKPFHSSEFAPLNIKDFDSQLIVNINEYLPQNQSQRQSKKQWQKRVSAAVASGIFQKDQQLFLDYHKKAVRKHNAKLLFWFVISIAIPLLFLLYRQFTIAKIEKSYGLIEKSKIAQRLHDTQVSLIFALEAYQKAPFLAEALTNLHQLAIPNDQEPRTYISNCINTAISSDGKKIACAFDNGIIRLLRYNDLSEIETFKDMHIRKMAFSPDSYKIGFLCIDSIKIYDVLQQKFIYSKCLNGFQMYSPYYHIGFDEQNKYFYICGIGNSIMQVNIENKQIDTIKINFKEYHYADINEYAHKLYIGKRDSISLKISVLDNKNLKLHPFFIIPNRTKNWIVNPQGYQIAYEMNDTIFWSTMDNDIMCGTGTIVSFDNSGERLLWYDNYGVYYTNNKGDVTLCYPFMEKEKKPISVQWGICNDVILIYKTHIKIVHGRYPNQVISTLNVPEILKLSIGKIVCTDSILHLYSKDGCSYFYNYTFGKNYKKNKHCTFDGKLYLYENSINRTENEIVCAQTKNDSIIWRSVGLPTFSISPNRTKCALNTNLYINKNCLTRKGVKLIDVNSGKILFKNDSASFLNFISDYIYVYKNRDSVFVADIETQNKIHWNNAGYFVNHIHYNDIEYAEANKKICAIPDSSGIKVYDFSKLKQLIDIPLQIDNYSSIRVGLSPHGDYLFIIQLHEYLDNVNEGHDHSTISIWDIAANKCIMQEKSNELCYRGYITNGGYLVLFELNHISIYEIHTGNKISTINVGGMSSDLVELTNGHILLHTLNSVMYEINPKKGKITRKIMDYIIDGIYYDGRGICYIKSGRNIINPNTGKIILELDQDQNLVSINNNIAILERTINNDKQEIVIVLDEKDALVRRVKQIVGQRKLTQQERNSIAAK